MAGTWNTPPLTYYPGTQIVDPATGALLADTVLNTELRDRMLWMAGEDGILTQLTPTSITADYATSSPDPQDIPGASVTFSASGNSPVLLVCCGPAHSILADGQIYFAQDGVDGMPAAAFTAGGQLNLPFTVLGLYAPMPGVHTYSLRGSAATGGTLTMNFGSVANGVFAAIELRR